MTTETEKMTIWKVANLFEDGTLADLPSNELNVAQLHVNRIRQQMLYWNCGETKMTVNLTSGGQHVQVVTVDLLDRINAFLTTQLAARYGCDD